jgi:hypothetical protein
MKAIIGGLVSGFAAYYLVKWIRSKGAQVSGLGSEAGVYANLFDIRDKLQKATQLFVDSSKKIEDLDMQLLKENDAYANSSPEMRPEILSRIAEIQRQRDLAVLEAELVIRNVINPLREKLITEEARLKSAVAAPDIAMSRIGRIPSF